mmetsp:Transcript_22645/g.31957  ORF Transcript_22645/g.31957 Transcript_22645/m.31957 type:complete len:108 (+) Transcript_22645:2882-3205(+)
MFLAPVLSARAAHAFFVYEIAVLVENCIVRAARQALAPYQLYLTIQERFESGYRSGHADSTIVAAVKRVQDEMEYAVLVAVAVHFVTHHGIPDPHYPSYVKYSLSDC